MINIRLANVEDLTTVERLAREIWPVTYNGIVPPDHFTLKPGDIVSISISGIGTLTNTVFQ